jgi:hypothetical protein
LTIVGLLEVVFFDLRLLVVSLLSLIMPTMYSAHDLMYRHCINIILLSMRSIIHFKNELALNNIRFFSHVFCFFISDSRITQTRLSAVNSTNR